MTYHERTVRPPLLRSRVRLTRPGRSNSTARANCGWVPKLSVIVPLCLSLATACSPLRASQAGLVPPDDSLLITTAALVARAAPLVRDVWSGFWSESPAVLIYRPGGHAVLLADVRPVAPEWHPAPTTAVPAHVCGRLYVRHGPLPGLSGNFDTEYSVEPITAIAVTMDESIESTLQTIFHEAFHAFQRGKFAPAHGVGGLGPLDEPQHDVTQLERGRAAAMLELERELLLRALSAPTDSVRSVIRAYLSVRVTRGLAVADEISALERNVERKEGSAEAVGVEAAALALDGRVSPPWPRALGSCWRPTDRRPSARARIPGSVRDCMELAWHPPPFWNGWERSGAARSPRE